MKAKIVCIEGYWNDDPLREEFDYRCLVVPQGLTDYQHQVMLELANDESLFYVFDEGERIIGKHTDFTVFFCNPIRDIELGEIA